MNKIYYSKNIYKELLEKLEQWGLKNGFAPSEMPSNQNLKGDLRDHPDLVYCYLKDGNVFNGNPAKLTPEYPGDCIYNACSTGKYFIHNVDVTDEELLMKARTSGLRILEVKQGYARCSVVPVSENAIVTSDRGIARAARAAGMEVLSIEPGDIELPGFDTGFIGGTCGVVHGAMSHPEGICFFNGSLDTHPDGERIREFITEHGVEIVEVPGKLRDIGSIIFRTVV